MKNVFITGVTGFIGGQLCSSLLDEGYCIWALVRAINKEEAKKRVMTRIGRKRGRLGRRLNIVLGDLQKKGIGIDDIARKVLSERCNYVIHCAGETRFNKHPYSYEVNFSGTKNLINEVAQWYSCPRLYYMSTASVNTCPSNSVIHEDDNWGGYANNYVTSKRKAEDIISDCGMNIVRLRPSIVVSRKLNSICYAKEILWAFPVSYEIGVVPFMKNSMIDIVPVDYVARSVIELMEKPQNRFDCYHISAGKAFSVSILECFERANKYYGSNISFVPYDEWEYHKKVHPKSALMRKLDIYTPFANANIVYSNDRITQELGSSMPRCHRLTDYLEHNLSLISHEDARAEASYP